MLDLALYSLAGAIYLISGGRWTIALAGTVLYYLHQSNTSKKVVTNDKPIKVEKSKKESPIYAVDFTSSSVTPAVTTRIPRNKVTVSRGKGRRSPKVIKATRPISEQDDATLTRSAVSLLHSQIYIFYTTLTGSSQRVARKLHEKLTNLEDLKNKPKLLSLDDDVDDLEEYFMKTPGGAESKNIYLMVLPSYETDSPIDYFLEHLKETYNDFRVDKYPLRSLLGFAVLGLGDSESWKGEQFCYQARLADRWLGKLGARRLYPVGQVCMKYEGEPKAQDWINGFSALLCDDEPFYIDTNELDDSDAEDGSEDVDGETLVDVEDMGDIIRKSGAKTAGEEQNVKQMVAKDSPTFKSLTKQGYTIVGSHSGVKICRWTKSALRGRGSCYKFAFYGIKSHLCMETTPSLACSNKCVFCWRHGTNPVAKSNWRWELDPPEKVFEGALQGHYQKIKQMRGVPGIQMDRFEEAFKVRHCALSLVGEPIFYPHINEFVELLHEQHISSFLVCNAQHPDQLANLRKVTQLYVSIDAPTKGDLKKVDRPLNGDFWERLMSCLNILKTKQSHQRTVFRLTLVKGFNMNDVSGYADMVIAAQPSQIEVKGATFCGSSNANGNPLTMQNIPFYEECKQFVQNLTNELKARGYKYDIAAEHAHSCCILIAHEKFMINGKWHTHIDYEKFFQLLESGTEFTDIDYVKETPSWACWGSEEAGFNPLDTKFDRKAEKLKKKAEREEKANRVLELQTAQ
ncbi:Piso0_004557 [Millerozyma farinosa CBS 7064]|uniref:S-adenosyl-L-methionine-dependent tRNA 4-demethylwyosine synthase n=1 Tax=Pichia sorbitophila (strain ATCC MYA-4447 / BCRC 22081 / CBS 7064 / NBRC 10061 / NRRL Y-12695) TaxID=559304 RepID=G8Y946_PICSO|nr:Piso0_004557 [Millerozyma farinosa CBS 7064]CCE84991.1 Piso0_004557 [Millerozyma farinosa CBS 7064]